MIDLWSYARGRRMPNSFGDLRPMTHIPSAFPYKKFQRPPHREEVTRVYLQRHWQVIRGAVRRQSPCFCDTMFSSSMRVTIKERTHESVQPVLNINPIACLR